MLSNKKRDSRKSAVPFLHNPELLLWRCATTGSAAGCGTTAASATTTTAAASAATTAALLLIALAYWFATKPLELHRAVGLKDRWPQIIGAVGLGAIFLYFLARGATFQQTRSLYIGLLVWGGMKLLEDKS